MLIIAGLSYWYTPKNSMLILQVQVASGSAVYSKTGKQGKSSVTAKFHYVSWFGASSEPTIA